MRTEYRRDRRQRNHLYVLRHRKRQRLNRKQKGKSGRPTKDPCSPVTAATEGTITSNTSATPAVTTPRRTSELLESLTVPSRSTNIADAVRSEEALSGSSHVAESSPTVGLNGSLEDQASDGASIIQFAKLSEVLQYNLIGDQKEGTMDGSIEVLSSKEMDEAIWKPVLMDHVLLRPKMQPQLESTTEDNAQNFKNKPKHSVVEPQMCNSEAVNLTLPSEYVSTEASDHFRRSPRQPRSLETKVTMKQRAPIAVSARTQKGKEISHNKKQKEKAAFSASTSKRKLVHIPERTLRLRARQSAMEIAATRKWKLKWDGPLFPRIPLVRI